VSRFVKTQLLQLQAYVCRRNLTDREEAHTVLLAQHVVRAPLLTPLIIQTD